MYPLGFLTMTDYPETRGMCVRIVNLALRMMANPLFDVEAFPAMLKPLAVGIDSHWLRQAHGYIEVARLVTRVHPNAARNAPAPISSSCAAWPQQKRLPAAVRCQ
jgi:hypothetical protein